MIKCPVCGLYDFERRNDFDICEICEWQNDGVQMGDPDYDGGANSESLNQYRARWQKEQEEAAVAV